MNGWRRKYLFMKGKPSTRESEEESSLGLFMFELCSVIEPHNRPACPQGFLAPIAALSVACSRSSKRPGGSLADLTAQSIATTLSLLVRNTMPSHILGDCDKIQNGPNLKNLKFRVTWLLLAVSPEQARQREGRSSCNKRFILKAAPKGTEK